MASKSEIEAARKRKNDQLAAIEHARNAERILKDPVVETALATIQNHYLQQILNSENGDVKGRELSFRMIRSCSDFKRALTFAIENGSIEQFEIDEEQRKQAAAEA